jgi:hypothetical protein
MVDNENLRPLGQVTMHHQRANYGQAQLRPPGLQKGDLLDQVLALPLGVLPPSVDVGHLVGQALEVHLNHVPSLACIQEVALQKGKLLSDLVGHPVNRGERGGALRLHHQHAFLGLPLG